MYFVITFYNSKFCLDTVVGRRIKDTKRILELYEHIQISFLEMMVVLGRFVEFTIIHE